MKTLAMLLLTTLHLCYMVGISTGAILIREISGTNNPEIKKFVDKGIGSITQLILDDAISDIPQKKDTSLKYDPFVESLRKDIVQYLSSLKSTETDEITFVNMPDTKEVSNTVADSSKNDKVGLSCNWDENTFKCCQSSVAVENTCLVAEVFTERIKLSHHIGSEIVWTRFLSYKRNIERTIREVSKEVYEENMPFESINWGEIFEHSMIVTEKAEDEDETAVGGEELTSTVTAKHCSWRGLVGQCWIILKIKKSYNVSFKVEIELPAYLKLSFSVNGRVRWSNSVGIGRNRIGLCTKSKTCFEFSWSRLPNSVFQICIRVTKLFGIKIKMSNLCIRKPLVWDKIPTTINPNSFKD